MRNLDLFTKQRLIDERFPLVDHLVVRRTVPVSTTRFWTSSSSTSTGTTMCWVSVILTRGWHQLGPTHGHVDTPILLGITTAAGTRHCSPLSSCTRTCVGSLRVCGAGGITVPHQPSWPRTTPEFTDGIPISRIERGGFPTPTRKKDNGQNDEGNEHHATNDHAPRERAAHTSDFLWPPVCHTRLLLHDAPPSAPALPAEYVARLSMRTGARSVLLRPSR